MLEYFLDDNDTSREAQIIRRAMLGISGRKVVPTTDQQVDGMMATASTQDPPKAPFVSELPPEKPSSAQADPVYERGLKAEQSLIDFVKKAAEEPGKSPSRGVFGSFRPERAIRSWYENNPDLAKDYNAANIQIGNASDQEEVIEKLSKNINDSQPFGSLGRETVNEDFRLLTPIPKATGGVSQVPTEEPIPQEAPNGPPSGVIGSQNASPEETVADDIPMEVPEGAFIINAAAAEVAGYGDIKKMILDAVGVARRLGVEISTGEDEAGDEEAVDLLVSKGEVYIEPTLAKIIGYDVLEKINNRGKREVARRQQEAEAQQQPPQEQPPQPPQAPPQPQMAQEGGFVKKKFADGGDIPLESEQDLFNFMLKQQREVPQKEVNPISDDALALADLEFEVDIVNRSKNDPVLRAAFQDAQGRMPSEYIEMRNMSIREAEQILASQERPSFYDVERVNRAKREGYKTLDSPSFDFKGQYSQTIKGFGPDRDTILTRAHSEQTDPTDVSATLYHELLHKGHQKLVGIPTTSFTRDKTGTLKYVLTTPEQADRARLLHLDVHRRTYEAYKDELSSEALKLFTAQVFDTYGSRATQPYMQKFIKNLISSEAPEVNPREIFKFNMLKKDLIPDDKARPIADAVFAEVAKLPPIRALDEELKTAYQKQRKNSQGFIPKK